MELRLRKRAPPTQTVYFSFAHDDLLHVCQSPIWSTCRHGYSEDQLLPLQRFDFTSAQWSGGSPVCVDCELEDGFNWEVAYMTDLCVSCAVLGDCAYVLGVYSLKYQNECPLHELNLEAMVWRKLEPKNKEQGPLFRLLGAGMVVCGDEALCVFGGCGSPSTSDRLQPECNFAHKSIFWLTNELHLFNVETGTWSSPETTGPRPPPCAGFSFNKFDLSRVILFGRAQQHRVVNEIHILDMENWHWCGAILPSRPADLWPDKRKLHSACVLFDPTPSDASEGCKSACDPSISHHKPQQLLFVLGGVSYEKPIPFNDAWILDINSVIWKKVNVKLKSRYSMAFGCHNRSQTEVELIVFGETFNFRRDGSNTTLLYLGLKTLYHSCVDYVAERYELYQPLLQQLLPPHIQTDIRVKRDKKVHYRVVQL